MMPNEEMLKSIRDFPRPKDVSGIRSFFGLVEQVGWVLNKCNDMAPLRLLLCSEVEFKWSEELEEVFVKAKESVVKSM